MPVYEYQAIADTGKTVKGILDADSPANARRKLMSTPCLLAQP